MKFDILAIQETLTDPCNATNQPPSFNCMETFYLKNDRGVSLSIKTSLLPQRINELEDDRADAIWATAVYNSKVMLIGNLYTNPNLTSSNTIQSSLANIDKARTYSKKYKIKDIIILGDFNSRNIKWGDSTCNTRGKLLDEYIVENDLLCAAPNSQTFKCTNGGSIIDLIILSRSAAKLCITSSVDEDVELFTGAPLRGHFPVIHQFKFFGNSSSKSPELIYKDIKNTDWQHWTSTLSSEIYNNIGHNLDSFSSPFTLWEKLLVLIKRVNDNIIPTKRVTEHSKPFWTPELSVLSKKLQLLKKKLRNKSTPENIILYKEAKYEFSEKLILEKNSWIRTELEELNVHDSIAFWKKYKKTLVGGSIEFLGNLEENGTLYTEPQHKEDILFKTFFEGAHMENCEFNVELDDDINESYSSVLRNETCDPGCSHANHQNSLNDTISQEEVYGAIEHLKNSAKSFDDDGLHPTLIKRLPVNAVNVLHKIFNLCLSLGCWNWEKSYVVFLKKDGKPNYLKAGAFRPITISSYIGKLLERIIERRIREHCDTENILDDEQEGFRANRNTTRYLYKLIANLKEAQRRKFTSFLLCLDFQKAFDSVWLKGLIVKLHKLNITGNILKVIDSFLSNRKIKLIINKTHGTYRTCGMFGLPQGSVLSPLLFIIFIRDMFDMDQISLECKAYTNVFKYADDGSIAVTHEDPQKCHNLAQKMCDHIGQWCKNWKMIINCDKNKTECLLIKPHSKKNWSHYQPQSLIINGKNIKYVRNTTVLGVVIDDKLLFSDHANKKVQQCWYTWYRLTRNTTRFNGLNVSSLVILFKTIVLTKLLYAAPVWLKNNIDRFKAFYSKVCLKISGATHHPSQNLALLAMGLEPLSVSYDLVATKFTLKAIHSDSNMKGIIMQLEGSRAHPFYHHIVLTKKYLQSKEHPTPCGSIRRLPMLSQFPEHLSFYSKLDIKDFKTHLWKEYLTLEADKKLKDVLNHTRFSSLRIDPRNHNILFPRTSKRLTDTKTMDLLHGHSTRFASFSYTVGTTSNPNCDICNVKDDNLHQLLSCIKYNSSYRDSISPLTRESPHIPLSIILEADKKQVNCFRNIAQLLS